MDVLATMRRGALSKLPYDTELEWVKIDGSIIDFDILNFTPSKYNIETEVAYFGDTSGTHTVFSWNNSVTQGTTLAVVDGKWDYHGKVPVVIDKWETISINGTGQYVSGQFAWVYNNGNGGKYLHIGTTTNLTGTGTAKVLIKRIKLIDASDGSVYTEFIPCLKNGLAAFYDTYRNTFFYSRRDDKPLQAGPSKQTFTQNLGVLMPQREAELTARDYVQAGLVHLVDGVENVSFGVHDESQKSIYDCITGRKVIANVEFEHGGSWLKSSFIDEPIYYSYSEDATITTVFTPNNYGWWLWDMGSFVSIDGYTGNRIEIGPHISGRYPLASYMASYSSPSLARVNGSFVKKSPNSITMVWHGDSKTFDVFDGTTFKGSANCSEVWAEGMTRWSYRCFYSLYFTEQYKFVLHNGRCYTRALTADEIAHNYKIDKARFKLP